MDTPDNTITHTKGQWELELNTITENDTWEDSCSGGEPDMERI